MEEQKQSRSFSRSFIVKTVLLLVVVAACIVVMTIFLSSMQTNLYLESYTEEMQTALDELPERLELAQEEDQDNTQTFDATYQALAGSIAFMANHGIGFGDTNGKMVDYARLLGVDNVLLVDKSGTVLANALASDADFPSSRFNQLRTVFEDGQPSEAVEIDLPEQGWSNRYYAARIDDDTMFVIEQDPALLNELIQDSGSTASVLGNLEVGQNGYVMAVSALDFLVEWHPDENLIGTDALSDGVDVENLEDGIFSWMTIEGEQLYCGVSLIDDTYYIAAVPRSDMNTARVITVGVILFAFIAVMLVILLYGIFVMRENEQKGVRQEDVREFRRLCINRTILRRTAILTLVGFLVILGIAYYMQTLFALSSQSVSNNEHAKDVVESMERTDDDIDAMTAQYGDRYLPICEVLGYILDEDPSLINREDLTELADVMQVQDIFVFEATNGDLVATTSGYNNYALIDDPNDPSYDFIKLLQGGADYVVQDPVFDEISGHLWQYIGVPLHNEDGLINGLVQITIRPTLLERLESTIDIATLLDDVKVGSNGFSFAINKADDTFAYFPINDYIVGDSVYDHGITEEQVADGYTDYITIDGEKYYVSSAETDDYYIYLAGTQTELMNERGPLTLVTGIISLICLIVVFLLLIFERKKNLHVLEPGQESNSDERIVQTTMPGGRTILTESAVSRWMGSNIKWNERTAWQKTVTVLRWIFIVLVVAICIAVIFQHQIFKNNALFSYILGNEWDHGFNIFAITACVMFICVALTVVAIVRWLLQLLATILNARGETICRLCRSFLRYIALIGMIYYCLTLLGVNVWTLLASAGILALAISLGAQSLVSDIVSGLFVIFEGDFRVGDIIMVDDWRGTVLEIGIRTTKVEDSLQNVKIIRNSDISNVVNMTKKLSFVSANYSIEYNESLEHVESILSKELPKIAERLPAIVHGPYYRGVTQLGDNSVDLKITMQCEEKNRFQLERDFNREMRLLFAQYDINIPFPQVVINEPTVQKQASAYEKWLASGYAEEQKEAFREETGQNEMAGENGEE